jgi:CRP-like cAMP-binding protein
MSALSFVPAALAGEPDPRTNALLRAIPAREWRRWSDYLEPVCLPLGMVLSESGRAPGYVYFPTTAVVSLLYLTRDGASSELAVIGREGMVGIPLVMGGNAMPNHALVQSPGQGFRLGAQVVIEEMRRGGELLALLLRYAQALMDQVAQTALCNRYYSIDQLLSRRLLMAHDRVPSGVLMMTQELLSSLLGVRREGVTTAALRLQACGAIRYSRGRIDILDRAQLEQLTNGHSPAGHPMVHTPHASMPDAGCATAGPVFRQLCDSEHTSAGSLA